MIGDSKDMDTRSESQMKRDDIEEADVGNMDSLEQDRRIRALEARVAKMPISITGVSGPKEFFDRQRDMRTALQRIASEDVGATDGSAQEILMGCVRIASDALAKGYA
jgi:hypothetical protein